MIISYISILKMSICGKIYKSYARNEDKFTLVHTSKCQELTVMIAFIEPTKVCAHVLAVDKCGYALIHRTLACAVPMRRYRDHDHMHQMVHGSAVRSCERATAILIAPRI